MELFALTKEEFITRSMAGEVFLHGNNKLFYDNSEDNPLRYEMDSLNGNWSLLDGKTKYFTLEQPKPKIERRWKYRIDKIGYTEETDCYYTDEKAKSVLNSLYYKAEDCFIDVEVKG